MEGILELLSSGTHGPGRNSALCCILAGCSQSCSGSSTNPSIASERVSQLQNLWISSASREGCAGMVSNSAHKPALPLLPWDVEGRWANLPHISGTTVGCLHIPEEATLGVVGVPSCRGNPAKEPRSDIIPQKQENFNMCNGNDANKAICRSLSRVPIPLPAPIHPPVQGWAVLGHKSHHWSDTEQEEINKSLCHQEMMLEGLTQRLFPGNAVRMAWNAGGTASPSPASCLLLEGLG